MPAPNGARLECGLGRSDSREPFAIKDGKIEIPNVPVAYREKLPVKVRARLDIDLAFSDGCRPYPYGAWRLLQS